MNQPDSAILDGDILAYQTAFWAEAHDPSEFPKKLKELVKKWTPSNVSSIRVALSCSRSDNFRRDEWPNYKISREDTYTPEYLKDIKDYIHHNYFTETIDKLEADDIMGINAPEAIAVTIDKDLKGVSGWHFNPDKDKEPKFVDEDSAYRFFCKQWMTGDATDCIPGLWRVGPKRADKFLDEWEQADWEDSILNLYLEEKYMVKDPCGLEPEQVAIAMARCVKILDHTQYDYNTLEHTLWNPKNGS